MFRCYYGSVYKDKLKISFKLSSRNTYFSIRFSQISMKSNLASICDNLSCTSCIALFISLVFSLKSFYLSENGFIRSMLTLVFKLVLGFIRVAECWCSFTIWNAPLYLFWSLSLIWDSFTWTLLSTL